MKVNIVKNVLSANDVVAQKNREYFKEAKVLVINIISSPGSGKTTLLEKTIPMLLPENKSAVIVGDLQTTRDAGRLSSHTKKVVQINTGMSCHLYANQITPCLRKLQLSGTDFLFIENVGNLVCPGEFDLGENVKIVLLSMPEGDDKVAKYPTVFRAADAVLLTKMDLAAHLEVDLKRIYNDLKKLNDRVKIFELSARTGKGMKTFIRWLKNIRNKNIGSKAKFISG